MLLRKMLHFVETADSEKLTVCYCSKGFRSVSGHGHMHCRHCPSSFRFRTQLFDHEAAAHTGAPTDSTDKALNDSISSDSVEKRSLHSQSSSRRESKKCDELSSGRKNTGGRQVVKTPEHTARLSRAESDSAKKGLSQQSSIRSESSKGKNTGEIIGEIAATSSAESFSLETMTSTATVEGASKKKAKQSDNGVGNKNDKKCNELSHEGKEAGDCHDIRTSHQADETSESILVEAFSHDKDTSRKKMKRSDSGDKKSGGKKCDERSSKEKNTDVEKSGISVPLQTFPPCKSAGGKKIKQSNIVEGNSDGEKFAKRVTICADGKEVISRVPCYSGDVVLSKATGGVRKARCPVCNKLFIHIKKLRNHVVCDHNVAIDSYGTLFSCIPCGYRTTLVRNFSRHQDTKCHRSNLRPGSGNNSSIKSTPQVFTSLADLCSQQQTEARLFYRSAAVVKSVEKQPPRVVWLGHLNHVCSSQCLSGLRTDRPSEDKIVSQTFRPRASLDAAVASVPSAAISVDTSNELTKLRRSSAQSPTKVTVGKSATQSRTVALTSDKKKKEAAPVPRTLKRVKMSLTRLRSAANKPSSPKKAITITDSDSNSEEVADVKNARRVTRQSNFDKKQTSSDTSKPSTPSANKQKDMLSKKSADIGGTVKAESSKKSACPAGSQRTEVMPVSSSGSTSSPSAVNISQQSLCKLPTSVAVKMPVVVVSTQQLPASDSSSIQISSPASAGSAISTAAVSSAALRSAPVIGVAKAVQSVATTTTTQTTAALNRSIYSLHRFSADTLWSELCRRGGMRTCDCGISFMDSTLYLLHRSCHSDLVPLKCAFCDHKSATCYDFHAHLLDHKK